MDLLASPVKLSIHPHATLLAEVQVALPNVPANPRMMDKSCCDTGLLAAVSMLRVSILVLSGDFIFFPLDIL